MAMHKVPTLVLGIGGIGCRIAANISDLLTPEARKKVAIVGIDTNVNDLKQLDGRGVRTIQTSDKRTVGEYLHFHPQHMTWFPVDKFTAAKSLLNGAGQIRAISRLGALAADERGAFLVLKEEVQRIRANRGDESNGSLTVMVVGSITGGTGAGLFLQIPFYIRKLMKDDAGLDNIIVRGMFVGSDLTVSVQPSNINRDAVRVNAYSCIKELNAMYRRQLPGQSSDNLKVDFYVPRSEADRDRISSEIRENLEHMEGIDPDYQVGDDADIIARGNPDIPYDYLYLIEGTNADGSIGDAPISSVENLVARMVHTLMFTPVSNNALSVEDNMILLDARYNGMNRYSSAGMTRLVYPRELVHEYVTLCTVRDLVRNEWLVIDNAFRDLVGQARSLQRTDGKTEVPQLKTKFPELFTKQVSGEGCLGRLYQEAFVVTPENDEVPRSDQYLRGIDELVAEVLASDDVKAASAACSLNEGKMNSFSSAGQEMTRTYNALSDFEKLAKVLAKDKPASIANELFPPSVQSMQQSHTNSHSIYHLLHNVHPLTARFLCYNMIQQLENRIERLSGSVSGIDLGDYLNEDFDLKEPGVQKPNQALRNIQDKQIPILRALGSDAGKIRKLKAKVQVHTQTQCSLIAQYLTDSLDLAVSRILLDRIEDLAENYAIFFKSISAMIHANNARIDSLENLQMPLGQVGVYCSRDALRRINAEYQNSVDNDLTTETKTAIFENLFGILASDFIAKTTVMTEFQKADHAAKKAKALDDTFHKAVVATVSNTVTQKGSGIVDMNISQALSRQYELKDTQAAVELDYTDYLREQIRRAMQMAAPMMAAGNNATIENTATAYLALHPDCAATEMGVPSAGATKTLFSPGTSEYTGHVEITPLLDSAFSRYEIICFRAKYKFSIEDLTKYSPTSENARAYRERISNLGRVPVNTGNPDDHLTVINPHLDRFWHEEAYLPSLYKSERKQDQANTYKAFIYSLGLDMFQRMADENILDEEGKARTFWYHQTTEGYNPVKARNSFIGNGYNDLFNSLSYNRRIKQQILTRARQFMRTRKGYYVAEELFEQIMEDPFIADLIQPTPGTGAQDEMNLLDIILKMREGMENASWLMLFTGLQDVLWEYCAFLFDKSERLVNNAVRNILGKMYANSAQARKADSQMTYGERELKNQIGNLLSNVYRR